MDLQALTWSHPWVQTGLGLAAVLLVAAVLQWLTQWLLTRGLARLGDAPDASAFTQVVFNRGVLRRAAQVVLPLVLGVGVYLLPHLPLAVATVVRNVTAALIVLFVARTLFKMLDVALQLYDRQALQSEHSRSRFVKAYIQAGQLLVAFSAVVIMIAALSDRSPLIVMSGFGAMSAVLMLVFQDTIKSFAAGLQIQGNDMLRVGDWIEVPQAGADGDVIDIALNTVKVQNWDKTIVTIPTWKLMSESFKNWRGMQESGGRRIKRTLMIDAGSIRFLSDAEIERLGKVELIADYMREKGDAVKISRAMKLHELGDVRGAVPANQRRLTNIGTFRAYIKAYLKANSGIHPDMTLMVRMLQPTPEGVPLELYCFTNTTAWLDYEAIQSDIFDHLLAILPEFGLRAFQAPGGADVVGLAQALQAAGDQGLGTAAS